VDSLKIEPGLAETMSEDWYRSWAVPGADSTWGGPVGCTEGTPVEVASLHAAALRPASDIYDGTDALSARLREHGETGFEGRLSDSVDSPPVAELLTFT
jgi:hypothetical protein